MENINKISFISLCVIMITLIIAFTTIYIVEQKSIVDLTNKCESHGGVLLKNTYRVGKPTSTTWVCVKPDIIIEL